MNLLGLWLALSVSVPWIDGATQRVGLEPLEATCLSGSTSDRRVWLVDDQRPAYLLQLTGTNEADTADGRLFGYDENGDVRALHAGRRYHWPGLLARIHFWETIEPARRAEGEQSGLGLLLETCLGGVYDRVFYPRPVELPDEGRHAATATIGFVLHVAGD